MCLLWIRSDLVFPNSEQPESPLSETKLLGTDFLTMHFTPLIRIPRCPAPTRKFRNGYVKSVEKNSKPDYQLSLVKSKSFSPHECNSGWTCMTQLGRLCSSFSRLIVFLMHALSAGPDWKNVCGAPTQWRMQKFLRVASSHNDKHRWS